MRRVSTRVLPDPAGARIASGTRGSVTAACWCGSRSSSNASWSGTRRPYRSAATSHERRRIVVARERGKAPSSLRCSQLRSPRGPSLGRRRSTGCPRRRPRRTSPAGHTQPRKAPHARPLVRPFRVRRVADPESAHRRTGIGDSTTAPVEGQEEIRGSHGAIFTCSQRELSCSDATPVPSRRGTDRRDRSRPTAKNRARTVAPRRYRWSHGDRAGSRNPAAQARRGGAGRRSVAGVVPALDVARRSAGGGRGARRTHAAPHRSRRGSTSSARARRLAREYGLPRPKKVRWSEHQRQRWGSCTPEDATIRVSSRLAAFPSWVLDYVLVHELAHLLVEHHGPAHDDLVNRFPLAERRPGIPDRQGPRSRRRRRVRRAAAALGRRPAVDGPRSPGRGVAASIGACRTRSGCSTTARRSRSTSARTGGTSRSTS